MVEAVMEWTGYKAMLETGRDERAAERAGNLQELLSVAAEVEARGESLTEFLEAAALASTADGHPGSSQDAPVVLMTAHTAKGLEFPTVFVVGLEEDLFPHSRSAGDDSAMEEERRLCYVAMTRARSRLVLTHARVRQQWGVTNVMRPSRFLGEIPGDLIEELDREPAVEFNRGRMAELRAAIARRVA
jgi:DNA helicase II / ATP-dependent DNA helicase PcrA